MVAHQSVLLSALAVAGGLLFSTASFAGSPNGTWLRPTNGAHIAVFDCDGGLGMKVATAPEPVNVGKTIMCGAKKTDDNKWQGSILNLDNGKTYSGYVTLNGDNLTMSGCVLGGLICSTETWSRIN
jgi:uncharacterized protein (DUF2147 family)